MITRSRQIITILLITCMIACAERVEITKFGYSIDPPIGAKWITPLPEVSPDHCYPWIALGEVRIEFLRTKIVSTNLSDAFNRWQERADSRHFPFRMFTSRTIRLKSGVTSIRATFQTKNEGNVTRYFLLNHANELVFVHIAYPDGVKTDVPEQLIENTLKPTFHPVQTR